MFTILRLSIIRGVLSCALLVMAALCSSLAVAVDPYIAKVGGAKLFPLVSSAKASPLYVSSNDFPGVLRVAKHLQADIKKVSGAQPKLFNQGVGKERVSGSSVVIIGTIGKNPIIDRLITEGKLNAEAVSGKWDTFGLQTVKNPLPGVKQALVIFGSDKRGTIYGIYDLSTQMGVSPWHWWADAPIQKSRELHVKWGFHSMGTPKVKYRGIFINDEAPALTNWAKEKFGGFNHKFYEKVYELILRNKGNYLWPAMWVPSAIYVDDPESARLADELGVVIATSHHEPMMRAHDEWRSGGGGSWNYETNSEQLREFWRGGIERMGNNESVVTVGMRGDGDEAMSEHTAIDLLQNIIADQRKIISEVTGRGAEETLQVWALYKEIQDYYDKGMRVPDDVMILLCDDNWGNIRILPKKEDRGRKGGFGIYYHFDFVGGPTSYRWQNVTQIERVWEQMNLAYEWGAQELWLVNVGDIKPMELPMSFFLDLAWNPEAIKSKGLPSYYRHWAKQQFGDLYAQEIAEILSLQTKYSARRTPEMLAPTTYSLNNYREADKVVEDYNLLLKRARAIYKKLPKSHRDSFYQLVLFPVESSSNLNEMYVAAGKSQAYAKQGRASANDYADQVKALFDKDGEFTRYYHEKLSKGKWNHMMSQTHIGYSTWNNPPVNIMPAVSRVQITKPEGMGFALEFGPGPGVSGKAVLRLEKVLPLFDRINDQNYYVDIFNIGLQELNYTIESKNDWIKIPSPKGRIKYDEKVYISIDWTKAPKTQSVGEIVISGAGQQFTVGVPVNGAIEAIVEGGVVGFVENNGVVSIDAENYTKAVNSKTIRWDTIPNLGRTQSSVIVSPSNADRQIPKGESPHLEYVFTVFEAGDLAIEAYLSPTLNYQKNEGLKYAISIDDEAPQIVNLHEGETEPDWEYPDWWNTTVTDHIKKKLSNHKIKVAGVHTLKVWMVDPGVVFQKFVINAGGLKPSYLGPPESVYKAPVYH